MVSYLASSAFKTLAFTAVSDCQKSIFKEDMFIRHAQMNMSEV